MHTRPCVDSRGVYDGIGTRTSLHPLKRHLTRLRAHLLTLDHTCTNACDSSPTNDDPRRRVGVALGPRVRAGGDAGRGALRRPGRPAVLRCQLLSAVVVFAAASPAHGAPLVQQPRRGWATAEGRAREGEETRRRRRAYVRARRQGECMRVWPWTAFFYGLECTSDR